MNRVKEKPILFSTEMVKAILEGRKTQTRRIIKSIGNQDHYGRLLCDWPLSEIPEMEDNELIWTLQTDVDDSKVFKYRIPYQIGQTLWVRETWCEHLEKIYYKANIYPFAWHVNYTSINGKIFKGWKSPYHMKRETARIFLEVTNIRVERLQDITKDDAKAEGVKAAYGFVNHKLQDSYRLAFIDLWDSLNKKRDYGWDKNPYVFVIEFEWKRV